MQPFFAPESAAEINERLAREAESVRRLGLRAVPSPLRMALGSVLVRAGSRLVPAPQDPCSPAPPGRTHPPLRRTSS